MLTMQIEKIVIEISRMERAELVRFLRGLDCDFDIDFTDEYLDSMSLDRLRHTAVAASIHSHTTATLQRRMSA